MAHHYMFTSMAYLVLCIWFRSIYMTRFRCSEQVTLEPGQALLVPGGYFHEVTALAAPPSSFCPFF